MAPGHQQLQRVERAWRQLEIGLRLRPAYHRVAHRIHAHIALSVMGSGQMALPIGQDNAHSSA